MQFGPDFSAVSENIDCLPAITAHLNLFIIPDDGLIYLKKYNYRGIIFMEKMSLSVSYNSFSID